MMGAQVSAGYSACQSYEKAQGDTENEYQQPPPKKVRSMAGSSAHLQTDSDAWKAGQSHETGAQGSAPGPPVICQHLSGMKGDEGEGIPPVFRYIIIMAGSAIP